MTEAEKLRLFVAVDIPKPLLDAIDDAIQPLRKKWPKGRWTPTANQHVTLKFLGWTLSDRFDELCSACNSVAERHLPAEIAIRELGSFPSKKRMRVLWVGLDDPNDLLKQVARDLDTGLEPLGFAPEEREFTPHLTLARFKMPQRLDEPLPSLDVTLDPFQIEELVLYRSHLSPKGPRYEAVHRAKLAERA